MNPLIPSRTLARLAGLALLLASSACRSDAPQATSASNGGAPLLARIEAERGDAACDTDAQCHTIGVGHKACGGPERYLAWSSKNSDGSRLRALVAAHAAARSAEDTKKGMMSTCSVVPDPGAACTAGHCVLRAAGAGPGGMAPVAR
ncbi:hypothetical protein [Massilia sp. Root335]|uniref:hypothetical protein n=1 Tax=Massilia sp. Root335 TaxID=1736517 RepID=UPI0006F91AA1|nr:hypothetical protein [Massilia sp. Root335]KQV51486.1 hypothetical protein ASC93_09235 [Massilia sp. Root335]